MRFWPVFLAVFFVFAQPQSVQAQTADTAAPLDITRVTPEGEDVPDGRQIVFTFNRAVVPLGRMERTADEIPVTITPPTSCDWRWINTSSLACQLGDKDAYKKSTAYQITMQPGMAAEDGATLADAYQHRFITQRADVRHAWFKTWRSPGTPVIRLTFNQPVTLKSAEGALSFKAADGKAYALKLSADPDDNTPPDFVAVPGERGRFMFFGRQTPRQSDDQKTVKNGVEARRVWLAEPISELPLDSKITLRLEPGLISAEGAEKSVQSRDVVTFDTFPAFEFLGVSCNDNANQPMTIKPGETAAQLCNPQGAIALMFSTPVKRSQVKAHFAFTPALGSKAAADDVWGDMAYEYSQLNRPHTKDNPYRVFLPPSLKAEATYTATLPQIKLGFWGKIAAWWRGLFGKATHLTALENEFGQRLSKGASVTFKTDRRKPNFELNHNTAVLESATDSEVPLYVNNLNKTIFNFSSLTAAGLKTGLKLEKDLPKVDNVQFAVPFDVRGALDGKSGVVYGHLDTEPLVDNKSPGERRLFAQVTPWQLHVKLGHFSTLVWVTDMATGAPVEGAKVTVYQDILSNMQEPKGNAMRGVATTDSQGIARLPGTEKIDPQLDLRYGWDDRDPKLFVRVDKGDDLALMPLSWDFAIDTWRVSDENIYATNRKKFGHIRSWGATAQGVYRAGDTIEYKFYVRNQDDRTLIPAPRTGYTLEIVDPMDNVVSTVDNITLNAFGAYAGAFKTADNAPVGWYAFRLKASFAPNGDSDEYDESGGFTWHPIRVLVSDFTPSPFRVTNSLNGDLFRDGQTVEVQSDARLHSGGAYTDAAARITALLKPTPFTSKNPAAAGFQFDTGDSDTDSRQVFQTVTVLDAKGDLATPFTLEKLDVVYGRLSVESAVQDDRGKYIAALAQADYVGRDRYVGLRGTQWIYNAKTESKIDYIVVDEQGDPVKDVPVTVSFERRVTKSTRVKGAGNAYLTHYNTEWESVSECKGASDVAAASCMFTPPQAGSYRAIATIADTKNRPHTTETGLWVAGKDYVLWENESEVLLPIVPEKTAYKVGDTARYLVKNPYPGARALVTIERYGVLDSFVTTLEGSTPMIEFPVKPDYLPGFYMSVLVTSPRAAAAAEDGQLDLGKPAFRMGYVTVPVSDPYKEIAVKVTTDQGVYRPRDTVKLSLNAVPRHPAGMEPVEIAVAVLDESVFDLIAGGAKNYDPYSGFYALQGLDLRNYNLLTRLIGRQKFEKKGANPGGDGGADLSIRDLFKFVAYWNPSIHADTQGNANVTFDLPDNLTGWRVLAMAVTPTDRLGLGQGTFKVNRPTEVRPVMPNQVTERDSFKAGFSVMNRTDKPRTISVSIKATGPIDAAKTPLTLKQDVTLDAYKRVTVYMPVQTTALPETADVEKGTLVFTVTAEDAVDGDGIVHKMPVGKMRSLETAANYGTTTDDKVSESVAFPDSIFPDVGGITVVLSPSVISTVEGAFKYMRDYAYLCWEQILSKGAMAAHYLNLKDYMPDSFTWPESDTLPQKTLDNAASFQAPNGGMTYFLAQDAYVSPYLSAYTGIAFNWLRTSGYKVPQAVETKLHGYLVNFLKNDIAPGFYSEGMRSTVHAVALAALADQGKITKADLERYRPHVKGMGLFGKAHFLQAALAVKDADDMATETAKDILSHANQTGGKFMFSEELDDSYARILSTPLRENCAILDSFTRLAGREYGRELVGDVPFKLVRTITQTRQNRDHWENTQENMFCMNALVNYSRVYENVKPAMEVVATFNGTPFGETSFTDLRDTAVTLGRPMQAADVGAKGAVDITRTGDGRLYYATRLHYATRSEFSKPANAGIEITREYSVERDGQWQMLRDTDTIKRGELIRADIYLSVPAARNFVVVDDPIPGGLEPVNSDLATASTVDAAKGDFKASDGSWFFKFSDWVGYQATRWSFYHKELRHDRAVFYSDYLPAGNYRLSYTAQAIAEGAFVRMPVHAEEMYDPDVYGKGVRGVLNVVAPE